MQSYHLEGFMSNIVYDEHSNLLKENYYAYEVQDVPEANLFSEIFIFAEVPRVSYNHRVVFMRMPEEN